MWAHNLNPVIFRISFLEVRYYGLVYVLGFFLCLWWMFYLKKKGQHSLAKDQITDLVFYLLLGVIIGSRLFEIFWEPKLYFSEPLALFKIWQGGMSFHGGLVGIVVSGWLYCRKQKISFWKIADFLSAPTMLALALGRVANFINGELVGRVTSVSWCVQFPGYSECRHPSTLYDAGKRALVFVWLFWLTFKEKKFKEGFIFWQFVFWEGLGRFFVDFYRQDTLYFHLSLGQWFSLIMVILAVVYFLKFYKQDWKSLLKIK